MVLFLFFFFQAEDGIRDGRVTGVQTCALPIWSAAGGSPRSCSPTGTTTTSPRPSRSEERRVGKSVDLGGRRIIKKKKKDKKTTTRHQCTTIRNIHSRTTYCTI